MFDGGLPHFWDERNIMLSKGIYAGNLIHEKLNHHAFQDMDRNIKGETVVAKLGSDFDILSQLRKVQSQISPTTLEESHNLEVLA